MSTDTEAKIAKLEKQLEQQNTVFKAQLDAFKVQLDSVKVQLESFKIRLERQNGLLDEMKLEAVAQYKRIEKLEGHLTDFSSDEESSGYHRDCGSPQKYRSPQKYWSHNWQQQ